MRMVEGMDVDPYPGFGSDSEEVDPRLGQVLQGRYRIHQRIASGGMGSVYRGERLGLGRPVAIKFLHAAMARDPQVMKRFELEAQAMSRLAHPNCVAVLDFGVDQIPYLVMDFVQGSPLRTAIDAGALVPRRAIKIARQMLAALGHAHAQGIVHRDIKPENIVLESTPGLADHARILDFGLAKLLGTDLGLTVGMAIGTPNYMAPEQTREGPVDGRADLYAVGIVLFEMLTAVKPFDSDEIGEVLLKQLGMPAPPLRKARPEAASLSAALEAVVARAMAKAPADRFATADEMIAALEAVPESDVTAGPALVRAPPPPANLGADATVLNTPARGITQGLLTVPENPSGLHAAPRMPSDGSGSVSAGLHRWMDGHPARLAGVSALGSALLVLAVVAIWPDDDPAGRGGRGRSQTSAAAGTGARAPVVFGPAPAEPPAAPNRGAPAAARSAAPVKRPSPSPAEKQARVRETRAARPAEQAAAEARAHFDSGRWGAGIEAHRLAIRLDPARRGDRTLIKLLIGSLDGDRRGERAAFLRELGSAAQPPLRDAARSHPNPKVRARAADLTRPAPPAAPPPARKRPFLQLL
jgi:eukaryotic-like serine/threonine-protein kinase